jgi:hypothetical protein
LQGIRQPTGITSHRELCRRDLRDWYDATRYLPIDFFGTVKALLDKELIVMGYQKVEPYDCVAYQAWEKDKGHPVKLSVRIQTMRIIGSLWYARQTQCEEIKPSLRVNAFIKHLTHIERDFAMRGFNILNIEGI